MKARDQHVKATAADFDLKRDQADFTFHIRDVRPYHTSGARASGAKQLIKPVAPGGARKRRKGQGGHLTTLPPSGLTLS
ncbi:hypothetical protein NBRC116590_30360 [Pelagimonas sp. KU-00592-HH]